MLPNRDDPDLERRANRLTLGLLAALLALIVPLVVLVVRGLGTGWPPGLVVAVLVLSFLVALLLHAVRMLRAWSREVLSEREAREERERDGSPPPT